MKILSTIITVLILTLSFGGKSHSQIKIFGFSFEMSDEEIMLRLGRNGYQDNYPVNEGEDFYFDVCFRDNKITSYKWCSVGKWSKLVGDNVYEIWIEISDSLDIFQLPEDDNITFYCEIFEGCQYNVEYIIRFLTNQFGNVLKTSNGNFVQETIYDETCLFGIYGDKICVDGYELRDDPSKPHIILYRGSSPYDNPHPERGRGNLNLELK